MVPFDGEIGLPASRSSLQTIGFVSYLAAKMSFFEVGTTLERFWDWTTGRLDKRMAPLLTQLAINYGRAAEAKGSPIGKRVPDTALVSAHGGPARVFEILAQHPFTVLALVASPDDLGFVKELEAMLKGAYGDLVGVAAIRRGHTEAQGMSAIPMDDQGALAAFSSSKSPTLLLVRPGSSGRDRMRVVELTSGSIEYQDTGGSAPVVVLLHGLVMNGTLWRHVVANLRKDFRCIVPTMPLGGHRFPVRPEFDLSPRNVAMLIGEFLDALDLRGVTLVENDAGRAQTFAGTRPTRVHRLVLASCEALENYPPGLPGKTVSLAAKVPGGLNAMVQPLRLRVLRRLPMALGLMTKRKIPNEITDSWLQPLLGQRRIRGDLERYLRAVDKGEMLEAAEQLRRYDRPTLVVWAEEDRVMPIDTGRRLAKTLPKSEFVTVPDSATLIPEDQPDVLSELIRKFIRSTPVPS